MTKNGVKKILVQIANSKNASYFEAKWSTHTRTTTKYWLKKTLNKNDIKPTQPRKPKERKQEKEAKTFTSWMSRLRKVFSPARYRLPRDLRSTRNDPIPRESSKKASLPKL